MSLHHLGATRSRRTIDHLLQTPDTFVWAPLPGMNHATACVHASPLMGAGFAQYTVAFEPAGCWQSQPGCSRFVYVLEGSVRATTTRSQTLIKGGYSYAPASGPLQITAESATRLMVIEKAFQKLDSLPAPPQFSGDERSIASGALLGDDAVQVRSLIPADPNYDFAVNTMTYQPGARLSMVEVHVMEHGLLMLEGEGIYRLGDSWYPVAAGDFIWMAPYCPQWFGALGSTPAKYLIYKDWNRAPLASASHR